MTSPSASKWLGSVKTVVVIIVVAVAIPSGEATSLVISIVICWLHFLLYSTSNLNGLPLAWRRRNRIKVFASIQQAHDKKIALKANA